MNFEFILDEDYLAFFILSTKMYNEDRKITDIKEKIYLDNQIGYKKIFGESILDGSVYLQDKDIEILVRKFIDTVIFQEIYKSHNSESKEAVAIKILKGYIRIEDSDLIKIEDDLWDKYRNGYKRLLSINSLMVPVFLKDGDIIRMLKSFKDTDEFIRLYKETEKYYFYVKRCWEENKDKINKYLREVLKYNVDIKIKVYISHPNTCQGHSIDNNKIAWGHYKGIDDKNYNIVYLVHEGLHCLIPFTDEESDVDSYIKHSIIELISDYELYSLLSGVSTLNEGHPYLWEYKQRIYPYWLAFVGLSKGKIIDRMRRDSIDNSNEDLVGIDFANMNIFGLIEFCKNEWNNINSYYNSKNRNNN